MSEEYATKDELDDIRAELLRQKIVFDSELRRQRDTYEERLAWTTDELRKREIECRSLQTSVSLLGQKVDQLERLLGSSKPPSRPPSPRAASPSTASSRPQSPGRGPIAPSTVGALRNPSPTPTGNRPASPFRRQNSLQLTSVRSVNMTRERSADPRPASSTPRLNTPRTDTATQVTTNTSGNSGVPRVSRLSIPLRR